MIVLFWYLVRILFAAFRIPKPSSGNHAITFGTPSRSDSLTTLTMKSSNNSDVGKDYRGGSSSTIGQEDQTPVILRRLNDLNIRVGTRTRLLIEIDNPTGVQVRWFHNNLEAESDRYQYIHEGGFYCLDIVPVTLQDEGLWVCTVQNYAGKSSTAAHLTLIVPKAFKKPIFVEQLRAVLTQRGIVSLECKVIGVPTPKLRWYKDDKEIKAGDIFALTANSNEDCLGIYTCEATNVMGTALSISKIQVTQTQFDGKCNSDSIIPHGPPPKFLKGLKNVSGKVGHFLFLECQVEIPPWPQNIGWYNDSGIINEGPLYHLIADGLGMYGVEIKSLRADHNTTWKCVATSSTGSKAITSCLVSVSCPKNYRVPRFLESLRAVMTDEGLVSFECKVIGYPTPQLSWFKDGKQLQPGDVYELTGSKSLGSYCCVAQNCMGESRSIAELTIEDIQNQLNESEKLQLTSNRQPPRFLLGLKSTETNINESFVFMVKITTESVPSITWYKDDEKLTESNRYQFSSEEYGTFILNIVPVEIDDQAEWKCVAINKFGQTVTSSFLKLNVPKNFKPPRFLEELRIAFSNEGSVNLECKVIGVPQPQLKWFKDGQELNPGDMHKIISGQSGTCCLGTYTCQAHNCMGTVSSSATLLTMEDKSTVKSCASEEYLSVINPLVRNESLSTIPEERTSQMEKSYTIEEPADVSFSFDGKEVTVSLYETPDLTHDEALQIIEMYADELSEHISEDNVVDLPSLRIVKQSSISGPVMMEALVIDVPTNFCQQHVQSDTDFDGVSLTEDITLENIDKSDSMCENSLEYFSDHLSSSNSKRDIFFSASETTPKNVLIKPQSENDDLLSFQTPKLFMSNSDDQILTQLNLNDKYKPQISQNVIGHLVRTESNNTEEEVSETLAEIDEDELLNNYSSSKIVTNSEDDKIIEMNIIKNKNVELVSEKMDTFEVISRPNVDEFLKYMKIILEGTMIKMHAHESCNFAGTPTELERSIQALHSLAWKFIEETERNNITELDKNTTYNVSSLMTAINASLLALEQIDDPFGVSDNIMNEIQSLVCFDLETFNNKQLLATEILDRLSDQIRNFIIVVNRQVATVTEQRIIAVLRNTIGTTLMYIKQLQQNNYKIKCININSLAPIFSMVHPLETILNDLVSLEELTNDDKRSNINLKEMLIPPISSIAYLLDNLNTTLKNENSDDDQDLKNIFDRINDSTNQFMILASKGIEGNNLAECFISFTKPINDLCCHLRRLGRSNENIVSSDYGSDDKLLLDFETLFDELMMDIDTLTNNVNVVRDYENNMNPLSSLLEPLQDIKIGLFQVNQVLLSNQTGSYMSSEVISCFEHLSQQLVQLNDCIINQSIVEETNKEMPFESSIKMMQNILFNDVIDDLGVNGILFGSVLKPLLQLQNIIVLKMASVESDLSFSEHTDVTSGGCNTQSLSLSLSNNAQTVLNNANNEKLKQNTTESSKIDIIAETCGMDNNKTQASTSKMINDFTLLENNMKHNLVTKKDFECDIGATFKDEEPNIIISEDDNETSGFEVLFDETDLETMSDFVEDEFFDNIIQSNVINTSSDLLLNEKIIDNINMNNCDNIPKHILESFEKSTQENSEFNSAVETFDEIQNILKNTTEEILDRTKQIYLSNNTNNDIPDNVLEYIKEEDKPNIIPLEESLDLNKIKTNIFPISNRNDQNKETETEILNINEDRTYDTNTIDSCDKDTLLINESCNISELIHDADSSVLDKYEDSDKLKYNDTFVTSNVICDTMKNKTEEINLSINLENPLNLSEPTFVPDDEIILKEDVFNANKCVINSFIQDELSMINNDEQEIIMFVENSEDITVLCKTQNKILDPNGLKNENSTKNIENENNSSNTNDKSLEATIIEYVNISKDPEIMENIINTSSDVNLVDNFIEVESKSIEMVKPMFNIFNEHYDVINEETNDVQNLDTNVIIDLSQTNYGILGEDKHSILNDRNKIDMNTTLEKEGEKEKDLLIEELNCRAVQEFPNITEINVPNLENIVCYEDHQIESHDVCEKIMEQIQDPKSSLKMKLTTVSDNIVINKMVEEQINLHENNTNVDNNMYNEVDKNEKQSHDNLQENINAIDLFDRETQNVTNLIEMCDSTNISISDLDDNRTENCIPRVISEQILKSDKDPSIHNEPNSCIIQNSSNSVDNAIISDNDVKTVNNVNSEISIPAQIINIDILNISFDNLLDKSKSIEEDNCIKDNDENGNNFKLLDTTDFTQNDDSKILDEQIVFKDDNLKIESMSENIEINNINIENYLNTDLPVNNTIIELEIAQDSISDKKESVYDVDNDTKKSKDEFNNEDQYKNTHNNNIVEDLNKDTVSENNDQITDICDVIPIIQKENKEMKNSVLLLIEENNAIIINETVTNEDTQLIDSCKFDKSEVEVKYEGENRDNFTYLEQITELDLTDNNKNSNSKYSESKELTTQVIRIIDDSNEKYNQVDNINIVNTNLLNNFPKVLVENPNDMITINEVISIDSIEQLDKQFENTERQLAKNLEGQKITILNDVVNIGENVTLISKRDVDNLSEETLDQKDKCINNIIIGEDKQNELNTVLDEISEIHTKHSTDEKLNTKNKTNIDKISCSQYENVQVKDNDNDIYNVAEINPLLVVDDNTALIVTEIDISDGVQIMNHPNINNENMVVNDINTHKNIIESVMDLKEINTVANNPLENNTKNIIFNAQGLNTNEDNFEYNEISEVDNIISEPVKQQSLVLFEECKENANEEIVVNDIIHCCEPKIESLNEKLTDYLTNDTEVSVSNVLKSSINYSGYKEKYNEIKPTEIKQNVSDSNDIEIKLETNNIISNIAENTENEQELENIKIEKLINIENPSTQLPKSECIIEISTTESQNIPDKIMCSTEIYQSSMIDDCTEVEQNHNDNFNLLNVLENKECNDMDTNVIKSENLVSENEKEKQIFNNELGTVNKIEIDHGIKVIEKSAILQNDLIPEGKINNLSIKEIVNTISLKPKLHCVEQMAANISENNMFENANVWKPDNNMEKIIDCVRVEHELNIAAIGNIVYDYDTIKENTSNEVDKQMSLENASITTVDKHLNEIMLKNVDILKAPNENLIMNETNNLVDEELNDSIKKSTVLCKNKNNSTLNILNDQVHNLDEISKDNLQTENVSIDELSEKKYIDTFIQENHTLNNILDDEITNDLEKSLNIVNEVFEPLKTNIVNLLNDGEEFKNRESSLVEVKNEELVKFDKNTISKVITDISKEGDLQNKSLSSDILKNICISENEIDEEPKIVDNKLKDKKENVLNEEENVEKFEMNLKLGIQEEFDKNVTTFFQKENDECVEDNGRNSSNDNIIDNQKSNQIDNNQSINITNINKVIQTIDININKKNITELGDKDNFKMIETKLETEIPMKNEEYVQKCPKNENDKNIVKDIKRSISNNNQVDIEEIKTIDTNNVISTNDDIEEDTKKQESKKNKISSPQPQGKKSPSPDLLMEISSDKNINENEYTSDNVTDNSIILSNKLLDKLQEKNNDKQNRIENTLITHMKNDESILHNSKKNISNDNDIDNTEKLKSLLEHKIFEKDDNNTPQSQLNKHDKPEGEDIEKNRSHNLIENQEQNKIGTNKTILIEDGSENEKKKRGSKKKRTSLHGKKSPSPDKSIGLPNDKNRNINQQIETNESKNDNITENICATSNTNIIDESKDEYKEKQNILQKTLVTKSKDIESTLYDGKTNITDDNDIDNSEKLKSLLEPEIFEEDNNNTSQSQLNKHDKLEGENIEKNISHNLIENQEQIKIDTNKTILIEDGSENEKKKRGSKKKRTSLHGKNSPSPDKSLGMSNDKKRNNSKKIENNESSNGFVTENNSKQILNELKEDFKDDQNEIQKTTITQKENTELMLIKNIIYNTEDFRNEGKTENDDEISNKDKIVINNNNEKQEYIKKQISFELQNKNTSSLLENSSEIDTMEEEIQKSHGSNEIDISGEKIKERLIRSSQEVNKNANELEQCNSKKSKRRDSKSNKSYEKHDQSTILKESVQIIKNTEFPELVYDLCHESLCNNNIDINYIPTTVADELRERVGNSNIQFEDNSQDKMIRLPERKKIYDNKLETENHTVKNPVFQKIENRKITIPINNHINYNITDRKERDWKSVKEIPTMTHFNTTTTDCQTNRDVFLDNFSMATDRRTFLSRDFKSNPKTMSLMKLDEPSKAGYDLGTNPSKRYLDVTDAYRYHTKPLTSRSLTPEPRCMLESIRYLRSSDSDTNKYRSSSRSLSPYPESSIRQNVDSFSTRNRWLATYRSPSEAVIRHCRPEDDLTYTSYGAMRRHGSDSFLHDSRSRDSAYYSRWKLSDRVSSSTVSTCTEDLTRTKEIFKRLYFCVRLVDQTVSSGSRVKFWCSIIGYPEPRVQWYKDGQRLNSLAYNFSTRYQSRYINGLVQLIIENAQSCDSGEYTCVAANSRDRISTTGYLTIYTSPSLFRAPPMKVDTNPLHSTRQYSYIGDDDLRSNIRFGNNYYDWRSSDDFTSRCPKNPKFVTSIISDDVATYGGTIALQVRVQGSPLPNITWMRESKPLPRSSVKYIYLDEGGLFTLLVKDSTTRDGGTYVCRACNLYGTADVEKSVKVVSSQDYSEHRGVKPAIIVSRPNDRLNVAVGEDITVTLRVAGEPKPKVIWMRGSRDVTFFDRSLKETVNDYVKLSIKKAQLSDAGTYFIVAKNVYGSDRAFVTVGVKKRARSLTPPQIRNTFSRLTLLRGDGGCNRGSYTNNKVPGPIRSEPTVSDRANNRISLTWDKPEKAETILVYRVEVQSTEEECWRQVGMTPTNSIDVYNLKPGYRYKFRVTARNRYGWGQPVVTSEYVDIMEPKYLPEFCQLLPGETKVLLHDSATLQCHVRGVPKPFRVTWYKDGEPLQVDEKYTISYTDRGKCTLTVTNTVFEDSGRYACEAINDQGRVCTLTVVEVIANRRLVEAERRLQGCLMKNKDFAESVPIFTKRLIDRSVEINSTVCLSCQISGLPPPMILWYKDSQPVDFTDNNKNLILDSDNFSTLELTDVTYDDSGVYKAVASNSIGTASTCCLLEVINKNHIDLAIPKFVFNLPHTYEATDSIILNAQIEAYRPTKVEWFRDGIQLRNGRRVDIITDHDGKLELRIADVTKRDSGSYTLRVSNDTGTIESYCDVNVVENKHYNTGLEQISLINHLYSKKPKFVIKPKFQEVEEGQEVVIDSEIVGDPLPKITWLRDGLKPEYYRDNSEFLCISNGNRYQLKIPHAKLTHTGTYTLLAANPHGQIKALISLQVFSPGRCKKKMENGINHTTVERLPRISRGLVDIECCENETVVFECKLNITQETDVRWKKDGRLVRLAKDDIKTELVDGNTARLKISTVSPLHEGLYTCIAYNELGQDSTSARLILSNSKDTDHRLSNGNSTITMLSSPILADESNERSTKRLKRSSAPKFYAVLHDKIADVGDSVRFQCSVSGYPPPWSSWEKDDQPIGINSRMSIREDNDQRSLEICDVTSDDAGVYRVTVENKYGKIQTTARLEVWSHHQTNDVQITSSTNGRRQSGSTACVGEDFTLSCDIRGNSMSDVTWYKNDEEINDCDDRVTSNRDELTARLSISNLELADTGVYTCIARSDSGVTRCSKELCVFDTKLAKDSYLQPPIFVEGLVPKRTVSEGKRVELTVILQGAVPMSATWFKDDVLIPDCEDFAYIVGDYGKFGLSIEDPFTADSGTYTCKVINKFGEAVSDGELVINESTSDKISPASQRTMDLQTEFNNNLNVHEKITSVSEPEKKSIATSTIPATILWGPCDTTVLRGARIVLETSYAGNPEPCIRWLKAGKTLESDGHLCITKVDGISSLTIDSITADDCGKYGVQVDNGLGNDYHFASVAVEGPPDPPAGRPVVSVSETSADVTWSSPAYDGGCMITGYSVEVRPFNQSDWKLVADKCYSLSHIVRGLAPGESYVFRVRAENMHGSSEASLESIPVYILQTDYGNTLEPKKVNIENGELFTKQYELLDELGKGRYGVVHKVKERESGKYYAAKFVRCIKSKDKEKAKEEVDIMNCLRHPKLLQLDAAFDNPREVVMVTEYISGGELFERVVADDFTLTEKDCILFTRQICEGVDYMHRQNVVHLDLKPENIMCQSRTSHQIKLIDFGLAQIIEPGKPVRVLFGTPEFIPPEIISYEPIGLESDMWSIGVICYVLLSGLSPFMGENDAETFTNITKAEFDFDDEAFDTISQDSKDFISALLIKRKEKRLNAKECMKHKWLAQQDMDMRCVILSTDKLKKFIIRRKWQKTGNAIRALGRMATLSAASRRGGSGTGTAFQQHKMASLSEEDSAGESSSPSPPHGDRRPSATVSVQNARRTIDVEESVAARTKSGCGGGGGGRRSFDARSDSGFSDCSSLASSTAHIRLSDKPSAIAEEKSPPTPTPVRAHNKITPNTAPVHRHPRPHHRPQTNGNTNTTPSHVLLSAGSAVGGGGVCETNRLIFDGAGRRDVSNVSGGIQRKEPIRIQTADNFKKAIAFWKQ